MRVGIVINTTWNIFNFRKGLIKGLQDAGHQVIAISPPDSYVDRLKELGCEYVPMPMDNKGANPLKDLGLIKRLRKAFKEAQLDVVLQYTIKPNIYGTLAARKLKIPVINNVSGLGTVFIRKNLVSKVAHKLYRYAFRFAHRIFFQNNDDRQLFLDFGLVDASKTDLLPGSGINLEKFSQVDLPAEARVNFLLIARMLYDKGVVEFAEATRILRDKGCSFNAWLCGFIDTSGDLGVPEKTIKSWEKEGLLEYLGTTDDISSLISKAHCVVLPSYREGTPRTLLEGAALGRPLIATNVPGCKEVVVDSKNGFLCAAKSAEDLARIMEDFLNLSALKMQELGNASRAHVEEKFDEKIVVQRYIDTLNELNHGI